MARRGRGVAGLLVLGALAGAPAPAAHAASVFARAKVEIDGAASGDRVGTVVADAGDVNGDGLPDVIVGLQHAHPHGARSGSAYVVFGRRSRAKVDVAHLGTGGFRIDGGEPEAHAGFAVAGARDVNGDGRADVIVGATGGTLGNLDVVDGAAFVVYGKSSSTPVELAHLGTTGFRIAGGGGGQLGFSVAGAGDVNGDGLADVIAGDPNGSTGHAYVVFGSRTTADVDTNTLGPRGFTIAQTNVDTGFSVDGAGDVNGDGNADVVVSDTASGSGAAFVVFGGPSTAPVALANLGTRGFRIDELAGPDDAVDTVAGAGDVNGDGRADIVVGSSGADFHGRTPSGAAWVIFGSSSTAPVRLAHLGSRGFRISGVLGERTGSVADGAGDLNGDGLADVAVGASLAAHRGHNSGSSYVVFGRRSSATVNLAALGSGGFRLDGPARGARAGWSVAGVANADGKGHDGLLVGAPYVNRGGRAAVGAAYLYTALRRAKT